MTNLYSTTFILFLLNIPHYPHPPPPLFTCDREKIEWWVKSLMQSVEKPSGASDHFDWEYASFGLQIEKNELSGKNDMYHKPEIFLKKHTQFWLNRLFLTVRCSP